MNIVITAASACTALGSTHQQTLEGLRSPAPRLVRQWLAPDLDIWYGSVPDAPPLSQRATDHTSIFAKRVTDECVKQAQLHAFAADRVATIIGCSKGRLHDLCAKSPMLDPLVFPGDTVGVEVAAQHQFTGPVLNYPAACATGLACIIAGSNLLRDHAIDVVLAGSAEASSYPLTVASFQNMGALSSRPMRPFHADRDGFNPGEGAAAFVVERESDALARGVSILGRIAGYDIRNDACHMTAAEKSGATLVHSVCRTLRCAGWQPTDVQYINAHGTGTPINDAIEARAIYEVFGDNCPPVSALKPYTGHLLGGSAAAELALTITALRSGFIPPTPGLALPDPSLTPIRHVPPGGLNQQVSRFIKLSLGFGGHIATVAVELLV